MKPLTHTLLLTLPLFLPSPTHANPTQPTTITLAFTGDISLSWRDKSYDPSHTPTQIARLDAFRTLLTNADLAIANSEGVLSKEPPPFSTTAMDMWMRPDYAQIYTRNGIDVVSIANNHAYDAFAPGVVETSSILTQHNLHVIGGARSVEDAYKPYIHRLPNQHCIAILPATTGSNKGRIPISEQRRYDLLKPKKRPPLFPGVPPTTHTPKHLPQEGFIALYPIHQPQQTPFLIEDQVRLAKQQCAYVVVYIHWAREKRDHPGSAYEDLGARIMHAGADLIVGHHPHILQGVDFTSDGRPIVYSLGNTVFANPDPRTQTGGILLATLSVPNTSPAKTEEKTHTNQSKSTTKTTHNTTTENEPRFTLKTLDLVPFDNALKDFTPQPTPPFRTREVAKRLRKISQRYSTHVTVTEDNVIRFTHDPKKVTWSYPKNSFKNQTPKP